MTRDELIDAMSIDAGITKEQAKKALKSLQAHLSAAMGAGETIWLPGFGTFGAAVKAPGKGRNPRTGEPIDIAASTRPTFKASSELRRILQPLAESHQNRKAA